MGWIVLKYGGTSVASATNWSGIADRVRALREGHRVWITASALAGVSNLLERAIDEAVHGGSTGAFTSIRAQHEHLASDVGIPLPEQVGELLGDLERLLEGIRLTGEASDRLRARVMSFGELASTHLGVGILGRHGVDACWVDARDVLRAQRPALGATHLRATVPVVQEPGRVEPLVGDARVVLTQGFIGRAPDGATVLLGRGGSDTSASLFGALLAADRVEIWTDVHGMFTSNPREIPTARLLRRLDYREAQELAAMGARVLHPRCLPPVAAHGIPLSIRNTEAPDAPWTSIEPDTSDDAVVTAVVRRTGVTLLTLSTLAMWETPGFLASVFVPFAETGISVDLVATSQSAVTVTLDHIPGGVAGTPFAKLVDTLGELGEVSVVHPCAVVSIVGRRIRAVLHELGGALQVFREHDVHLVSESSEDLNLSFVVDEADAPRLVQRLHGVLFPPQGDDPRLGPSWEQLRGASGLADPAVERPRWWEAERGRLHHLCPEGEARYAYDLRVVRRQAEALRTGLTQVGRLYYAMKANPHARVLETLAGEGFGMECVSIGEVRRVRQVLGAEVPILFTPNFCPVGEYDEALQLGAEVTIDGPDLLTLAPDVFRGSEVAVRVDPGGGAGHHEKVVTAGAHAKFGHPVRELQTVLAAADALGTRIVGLHAHVGSGILTPDNWRRTGAVLAEAARDLADLRWIDLGGGLGVVERPAQRPLDLAAVDARLGTLRPLLAEGVELRMEPGRYLVSEAGVLLARVTQVRDKGGVRFVGLATGMNSLLRPALYGAWHGIHNLTRLEASSTGYAHVVGPICETGDILGRDRLLPETRPGDLMVIENAGAYGRAMSSHYNERAPAEVVVIG